jgi:hypothetical protein
VSRHPVGSVTKRIIIILIAIPRRVVIDRLSELLPAVERGDLRVEIAHGRLHLWPRFERIEPPDMRQQQPRIEPRAARDLLAVIKHRLLDAIERAVGQDLLGDRLGGDQRRVPGLLESGRSAPRAIGGLRRDTRGAAGEPDIAALRKLGEKGGLPPWGEDCVAKRSPLFFRGGGLGVVARRVGRCRVRNHPSIPSLGKEGKLGLGLSAMRDREMFRHCAIHR